MICLTGDTHGDFKRLYDFYAQNPSLTISDVVIILGDAGFNYFGDIRDRGKKLLVSKLPFTVFCIHGNHEMRPTSVADYQTLQWKGGTVYQEPDFPNILFAKDGEIFDFDGKKAIALGGAYSVDKHYRLAHGYHWFEDEQPSNEIKQAVEKQLAAVNWQVDVVLSHTCPARYIPTEAFIEGIDQSTVDNSTENWLDSIEQKLEYQQWYCGHYHIEKQIDTLAFFYRSIREWLQPFSQQ